MANYKLKKKYLVKYTNYNVPNTIIVTFSVQFTQTMFKLCVT